jgi:gliding motility-associated protein GldL
MAAAIPPKVSKIFDVIVSVAAAVVIYGALQKLLHTPIADVMLKIGLTAEAAIFLGYGILYLIYPSIDDHEVHLPKTAAATTTPSLAKLDDMLKDADITPTNLQKLSVGFQKLGTTVDKMGEIGDVVKSTGDFTANTKTAAEALNTLKEGVLKSAGTMASFNDASESSKQFHGQVQTLTKNLGALNTIYEIELQDTNNHLKAMSNFFGNLTTVSASMQGSVADAQKAQEQIALLAKNLGSLNNVYGNMLSAMQGSRA